MERDENMVADARGAPRAGCLLMILERVLQIDPQVVDQEGAKEEAVTPTIPQRRGRPKKIRQREGLPSRTGIHKGRTGG